MLEKSFFGVLLHILGCVLLRMQQKAGENAVAGRVPPHAYVELGLQPDLLIPGEIDREAS